MFKRDGEIEEMPGTSGGLQGFIELLAFCNGCPLSTLSCLSVFLSKKNWTNLCGLVKPSNKGIVSLFKAFCCTLGVFTLWPRQVYNKHLWTLQRAERFAQAFQVRYAHGVRFVFDFCSTFARVFEPLAGDVFACIWIGRFSCPLHTVFDLFWAMQYMQYVHVAVLRGAGYCHRWRTSCRSPYPTSHLMKSHGVNEEILEHRWKVTWCTERQTPEHSRILACLVGLVAGWN